MIISALDIKNAVIHILDRDTEEPLLNAFELDMNEDIQNFLEKHIIKAMQDDEARKAVFKEGRNLIREVCIHMAANAAYFLEGSQELARQLFKAMKTNSSISSTDLIVCLYEIEGQSSVAVLKMDYGTSFIHDIERIGDRFKISIRKQDISLPGVNQKIQKCAFVRANVLQEEFDLIILDNQITNAANKEPVAHFFLQTFLDAELIADSKACTQIFKRETEAWIRSKSKEGEPFVEEIREYVNQVIREEDEIDVTDFSCKVFENKQDLRADYLNNMKEKGLPAERFDVDKEWVDRRLSKIRLKTESGIEVVIPYEYFADKGKFEIVGNPDGTRSILIKNITSISER